VFGALGSEEVAERKARMSSKVGSSFGSVLTRTSEATGIGSVPCRPRGSPILGGGCGRHFFVESLDFNDLLVAEGLGPVPSLSEPSMMITSFSFPLTEAFERSMGPFP